MPHTARADGPHRARVEAQPPPGPTAVRLPPRPADPHRAKLDRLVALARGRRRAVIVTHDNPDPDSIAAGVALAWLLGELVGLETVVAYGGIVGRAENRALIEALRLPVVPLSRVEILPDDLLCMVDTQPEQGNHSLPAGHRPDVIVDHHPMRPASRLAPIADVGGPIGATSTVLVEYLRASGLLVPTAIATALFYGIKADTRDLGRHTTDQDVDAYLWLFPRTDKDALGAIEHPTRPAGYFALSALAVERARVYRGAVLVPLGRIPAPDLVAEVAERLLYLEGTGWSLAWGEYRGDLYYSVRTLDPGANAGRLIREVIEPRGGSAGGHGSMAGAQLPARNLTRAARARLEREVAAAFLAASGVPAGRPRRLLPPRRTARR